jgi:glycosyltransferase involved in cell wall biosynthesis
VIAQSADAPPTVMQTKETARVSAASGTSNCTLHVLTLTPFYPTEKKSSGGCFIAEPLGELIGAGLQSTVFAVDPVYREESRAISNTPAASWYRYPSLPGGLGLASAGIGLYWRLRDDVTALHRESRIDLIHAHATLPCGHAASLLSRDLKIPYIVTVHGLDAFSAMQVGGWAGEWCRYVSQRVFQDARRVIGVSRRVCEEVGKGTVGTLPTSVVYNGVDPVVFTPGPETSMPTLLTVGNLIPSKGHELVVRSLAALKPEFPGLTWEVIGDGPELDRIRCLAQALGVLGNIRFLGRRSHQAVADACRRCTVFVLPSRSEGLGCVYLEAMSCAKPAVGCLEQGIAEVIRHGENGWLVPPGGLAELIEGLRVLLSNADIRAQVGSAARQTMLDGFTLQQQAQHLMAIYRECAG